MKLTILLQTLLETARWYEPEVTADGFLTIIRAWMSNEPFPAARVSKGILTKRFLQQIEDCSTAPIIDIEDVVDGLSEGSRINPSVIGSIFRDLVVSASDGNLDPVIGRDLELNALIQSLCRRKKNNAIITGVAGTGKTALVEKLAQRIADGLVPPQLQRVPIYVFNVVQLESMNSGLLKTLIKELEESNIIIFIDEIHLLMSQQYKSISELLKPALVRGRFRCIGATTREEYVRHLSEDAAFRRRFERLDLDELSEGDTLAVLHGLRPIYEEEYNVIIPPEVLLSIVRFSKRYLPGVFPDKCIDTLEQVCVRKTMPTATKNHLRENNFVLHHKSQLIKTSDRQRIEPSDVKTTIELSAKTKICDISRNAIQEKLTDEIVGMSKQIAEIIPVILKSHNVHRTTGALGSMLFSGSDGTGREYTARRICNLLFGSEDSFLEIDIGYYSDHYNISKLVGAPAGYVGYEYGGGLLAKYVRDHPNGVVFLKNLEADRSSIVMTLFKKAIETGKITTASGMEVDFRNHLFIGSYNESSARILGFGDRLGCGSIPDFPFLHPVVQFHPLDKAGILEVIHREFARKQQEMSSQGILLSADKKVLDHIGELSSSVTEAMGIFNREIIDQIGYEDTNISFTIDGGRIKKNTG